MGTLRGRRRASLPGEEWMNVDHRPAGPPPDDSPGVRGLLTELLIPQVVMNGQTLRRVVTVLNPQGLHMRPAANFAKLARQFQCTVIVRRDDREVNGKSQLDLLLLAAEPGTQLVLEVSGDDAADAVAVLAAALEAVSAGDEDDTVGPPPKG
jgi:phosphotransferase system HPr (HPr) family protein